MDGTVDASATSQCFVRGVDDRVDAQPSNVSLEDRDHWT
jgi:hypothetical protein